MNSKLNTKEVIMAALLCAIGIMIPMISPIKIVLEPASFTLASHVAIFIAMFISTKVALLVTVGTTIGFFIGGFPIVVVARALSHLVFVIVGWSLIKNKESITIKGSLGSSFIIGMIHGICEVLVVIPFYFNSSLSPAYYDKGFLQGVILLVGVGTVIHSMLDFSLSVYIWNLLPKGFVNKIGKEEKLGKVQKV